MVPPLGVCFLYLLGVLWLLILSASATPSQTSEAEAAALAEEATSSSVLARSEKEILTLRAGVMIPPPTRDNEGFGGFQRELMERLVAFAGELDDVRLEFQETQVKSDAYTANLDLLAERNSNGSAVDIIVGDYWASPSRYERVDFTPSWLQTTVSALRVNVTTEGNNYDVTLLSEAAEKGAPVCIDQRQDQDTYHAAQLVAKLYPGLNVVSCHTLYDKELEDEEETLYTCVDLLRANYCTLWVSDELLLQQHAKGDDGDDLIRTPERLQNHQLVWPVRRGLDTATSRLFNKWMYAAISNQTTQELQTKYFEREKLCPLGFAGPNCDRHCNPDQGRANSWGRCVCDSIRWAGHDCNRYRPEDLNLIRPHVKSFSYVLMGMNMVVAVGCAVFLFLYRNRPQVRVSQPFFLVLILLGVCISTSSIFALSREDAGHGPVYACMLVPWLYSIGFSITFGALFAKVYKVFRIFSQDFTLTRVSASSVKPKSIKLDNSEAITFILAVLLLDATILSTWSIVDPLEWNRYRVRNDKYLVPLESEGYCSSDSWLIFGGIIGVLHFALLAVGACLCYYARNVPTKYSEHKFVSLAMISSLQMFIVGIPILAIIGTDTEAMLLVRSLVISMNDLVVLALIFGNLIYNVSQGLKADMSSSGGNRSDIEAAIKRFASDPGRSSSKEKSSTAADNTVLCLQADIVEYQKRKQSVDQQKRRPPSARRKPLVSALSMGSAYEGRGHKTVSFAENVELSEYILYEGSESGEPNMDPNEDGSQRFSPDQIQGAPRAPIRHCRSIGSGSSSSSMSSSIESHFGSKGLRDSERSPVRPTRLPSQCTGDCEGSNGTDASTYTAPPQDLQDTAIDACTTCTAVTINSWEHPLSQGDVSHKESGQCSSLRSGRTANSWAKIDITDESSAARSATGAHHGRFPITERNMKSSPGKGAEESFASIESGCVSHNLRSEEEVHTLTNPPSVVEQTSPQTPDRWGAGRGSFCTSEATPDSLRSASRRSSDCSGTAPSMPMRVESSRTIQTSLLIEFSDHS